MDASGILTRDDVFVALAEGVDVEWLFFWGHTSTSDGHVGPHVFSQSFDAPFTVDGVTYPTAEHWMMAHKARLFGDVESERPWSMPPTRPTPDRSARGARLRRTDLECPPVRHRRSRQRQKFTQHPDLRTYLDSTVGKVLVEASPRDNVWGIGLAESDTAATDPSRWRGPNLLGFALMQVRARLRCP